MTADAETLSRLYELGPVRAAPVPLAGGLKHKAYRLETARGDYVVKALNPSLAAVPGACDGFRRSEQAAAALAALGLPALPALRGPDGTAVTEIGTQAFLVFPWCEGRALAPVPAPPAQAHQIGVLLGRIHAQNLPWDGAEVFSSAPAEAHWHALAAQARRLNAAWAGTLEAALSALEDWGRRAAAAARALPQPPIVSHRDLDQKNVLWRGPRDPVIIDWEAAGPVAPALDVMTAALNWGGQSSGPPDRAAFEAVLRGYRAVCGFSVADARPALEGRLTAWLVWLEFNVERALQGEAAPPPEHARTVQEIGTCLSVLSALSAGIPRWASWAEELGE